MNVPEIRTRKGRLSLVLILWVNKKKEKRKEMNKQKRKLKTISTLVTPPASASNGKRINARITLTAQINLH